MPAAGLSGSDGSSPAIPAVYGSAPPGEDEGRRVEGGGVGEGRCVGSGGGEACGGWGSGWSGDLLLSVP